MIFITPLSTNRSNEVFATFKTEMGKMSKTIKKLEKDNILWKGKHEQASKNMFSMAEEVFTGWPILFDSFFL